MIPHISNPTVTIPDSSNTSSAADLNGVTLCGFYTPAGLSGTTMSFTACTSSNGTFLTVYSGGAPYTVTVAASVYVSIDPSVFAGVRFIKLVSGSTESGGDTIILATRPVQ